VDLRNPADSADAPGLGSVDPTLICPHCGEKGHVRTRSVRRGREDGGGRPSGGIIVGGLALLATGFARKTQAHCNLCDSTWTY